MSMDNKLRIVILKLKLYQLTLSTLFLAGVFVPFFNSRGLDQFHIALLQSIFLGISILLDTPTGYFADRAGLKRSMVIGAIIALAGFGVYYFARSFWFMACAETLIGIGYSFSSGTISAFGYDKLHSLGDHTIRKFEYACENYKLIGIAGGSIVGGIVAAKFGFNQVLILDILVTALSIIIAATLPQTATKRHEVKSNIAEFFRIIKITAKHHKLKWIFLYNSVISCSTYLFVWISGKYYIEAGINSRWYGILYAALSIAAIAYSKVLPKVLERINWTTQLSIPVAVLLFSYLSLGVLPISIYCVAMIFVLWINRSIAGPISRSMINANSDSQYRTTTLSVASTMSRMFNLIINPLVSYFIVVKSVRFGILVGLVILLPIAILSTFKLQKHEK